MFRAFLREQVTRAGRHPSSLAWLLAGADAAALQAHLGCTEETLWWLQLFGRPQRRNWQHDVRQIATDLGLDLVRLARVIRHAEARARRTAPDRRAAGPPRRRGEGAAAGAARMAG